MKNLFRLTSIICLGIFTLVLSCSKSATKAKLVATTHFTANNQEYSWTGSEGENSSCILCKLVIEDSGDYFTFVATDPLYYANILKIKILGSTLTAGTYTLSIVTPTPASNAPHSFVIVSETYADATSIGDYGTVIITKIHDGNLADGSFSAKLTQPPYLPSSPNVNIANGTFSNFLIP